MGMIITEIPVFLLIAGKGKIQFLISLAVFSVILLAMTAVRKKKNIPFRFSMRYPIADTVICSGLALLFFRRWGFSLRMQPVADFLNLPIKQCCMVIAFLLALLSLPGTDQIITTVRRLLPSSAPGKPRSEKQLLIFWLLFLSFLIMFINSKCSPLYSFQDGNDQNTMFTVGKGVLKGYVPYRDLYEQKGPLLIFIHTFGAACSYYGFWGIWILEILACFCFLYLSCKITALFAGSKAIPFAALFAAAVYTAPAFGMGDSAEEFSLPLIAYAFYAGIKALKNDDFLTGKEFFLIGLTSGAVFWIKYAMVGFYFGWITVILIYAVLKHKISELLRGILLIAAGIVVITIPIFLYFLLNSALTDLFRAYFYNNLVYYPAYRNWPYLRKLRYSLISYRTNAFIPMILSILSLLYTLFKKHWKIAAFLVITFLPAYHFVYVSGNYHFYYCFIFCVYSTIGICLLPDLLSLIPNAADAMRNSLYQFSAPILFAGVFGLCLFSQNLPSMEIPKGELLPFRMKEIVEDSGIENPGILHFRILDTGVNTTAGLLPNMKYFCYYNNDHLTETLEQQLQCLEEQCVDFVIEQSSSPYTYRSIETYEHRGVIPSWQGEELCYFHYFTPK